MIETSVKCVIKEPLTSRYILVLETLCGHYMIPIHIGAFEAESIYCILNKIKSPRPMTYDFISGLINYIDEVNIDRVVIDRYEDGIYKASVFANCKKTEKSIDCRPTDAVSLALNMEIPIYIEDDVLDCKCVDKKCISPIDSKTLDSLMTDNSATFWHS